MIRRFILSLLLCAAAAHVAWAVQPGESQRLEMTVDDLFALIDANSRVLKLKEFELDEASRNVSVAESARLPVVTASLAGGYLGNGYLTDRKFGDGMAVSNPHGVNNFALEAAQVLYAGGAITGGIRISKLAERINKLGYERARADVRILVLGWFFDLKTLYNRQAILTSNCQLALQVLEDMKTRFQQGIVLKNDLTRYELQIKDLELQQERVAESIRNLNYRLTNAIGLDTETSIMPVIDVEDTDPSTASRSYWMDQSEANSPGLRQAGLSVDINETRERIERAQLYPRLSLFAYGNLNGPIVTEVPVINRNIMVWGFGLTLNYNISSLWTAKKRIDAARAVTWQSRQDYDIAMERLRNDVQETWQHHQTLVYEVRTCRKSLELAMENYDIVNTRFQQGMAIVTDMVDAANVRISAEHALQNAMTSLLFCKYRLKYLSNQL